MAALSRRFSASSFCDFWKVTFSNFITFFSFTAKEIFKFVLMCVIRRIIAYLCLNMINFDAVDFSERRSEEVISFFWRSVYMYLCRGYPGLIVTRQVVTVTFSQKLEESRSSELCRMKSTSNMLCIRNLEMIIDGKKKTISPKTYFVLSE